ncbi:Mannose-6-phosphate isomerase [Yarrowia sp. C11]|nr:Mannose-6-phosphate isomerase [Yarrowia sp. E02]KAG5372574.1 Mannose-6-phosphate isomerase [Yarrowia sp. C11]
MSLIQLQCGAQTYDWGKLGSSSAVARFAAKSDPSLTVSEDTPYAELWMGTHPSVPSKVMGDTNSTTLRQLITASPDKLLTPAVENKFGPELPFLFKVLSIRKALSIQAHPDKELGAQLHASDPAHYPDANHKPEMAIALTDFEGFCGFRPLSEIEHFLETVPEFRELVGDESAKQFAAERSADSKKALQALFGRLMRSSDDLVASKAADLVKRAESEGSKFAGGAPIGGTDLANLIVRLNGQFPNDIGLFCGGLMLNFVRLKKGEAMFLRAKDPHAYISGDIIECMAASDNVVRAGFTPKFKDVDNLVSMLTYSTAPVSEQKMVAQPFPRAHGATAKLFDPPINEFSVLESAVPSGESQTVDGIEGPSVVIVSQGAGEITVAGESKKLEEGFVFFIGPNEKVEVKSSGKEELTLYRAFCEVN